MNIKYVNVVLDKKMFMDKMRDICVPKVELPREPEVNVHNLRLRFYIAVFMVGFNTMYVTTEYINDTLIPLDVMMLLMWIVTLALWFMDYKRAGYVKSMNSTATAIETITNSELNRLWDEYSYDNAVHEKMFATVNDTCRLLWIVYNTDIQGIDTECDDTKWTLTVKYNYLGEQYEDTLNVDVVNCENNPNSVSIVKDGIILSSHNEAIPHALLSKTLC